MAIRAEGRSLSGWFWLRAVSCAPVGSEVPDETRVYLNGIEWARLPYALSPEQLCDFADLFYRFFEKGFREGDWYRTEATRRTLGLSSRNRDQV